MKKIILTLLVMVITVSGLAYAEEIRFGADIESGKVSVGNPIYLYLSFAGSQDVAPPEMPQVDGLNISYVGPSKKNVMG